MAASYQTRASTGEHLGVATKPHQTADQTKKGESADVDGEKNGEDGREGSGGRIEGTRDRGNYNYGPRK